MVKCQDVITAARSVRDWEPFVEPKDKDAIVRAMSNVVEHLKQEGSSREDEAPIPAYALRFVSNAIRHVNNLARRHEAEAEKFAKDRKKVHIF
jgi:hypothetical protein